MPSLRAALAAALLVTPLVAAAPARADSTAIVTGTVEDALLHPLPDATVVIHDASGKTVASAKTGPDGKFTFANIPFGDYTVEASSPGLVEDHQHLQLSSAGAAPVELTLTSEEVISIHEDWSVPAPPPATGSVSTVNRQTLSELPGAEDRPITDVVGTQPGVVADALGNIYVRGNHANVQYQVDGLPVPDSVGSLFAASIPVRLVDSLDVITGGMPAEYGDRLGAVVNLVTRQAGAHPEGTAQVRYGSFQTVEPGVSYATKLSDTTGAFVGGSYQYSQRSLDPPSIDPILHDTGTSGRVFARFDWQPCECNHYEAFVTYAHNRFEIPIDPTLTTPPHDTDAHETEDELFAAVSFTHTYGEHGENGKILVAPIYKLSRGVLNSDPLRALGETSDPGSTASDVTRRAQHMGGVARYTLTRGGHSMATGAQVDTLFGRTDYTAFLRDDANPGKDVINGGSGIDRTSAVTSGIYAQDHWLSGHLALDFGVRLDEQHVSTAGQKADDFGVSPRLGASYAVTKDLVFHAYTGVLWQPPAPLDAGDAARALGVVPAGQSIAYDLKPEYDLYAEVGLRTKLAKQIGASLAGYGRYAYDQLDDTAIGSTSLLSNYNFDRGRAAGIEAGLDLRVGPWLSAFANGSLGLAQGRGIASAKYLFDAATLANQDWQTLDHAQTYTANAGVTVRDKRFSVTSLLSYGSGLRSGENNDSHVPGHVTVDVATQYTFVPHGYPVRVGVDVENLFDAHYAYRIANGFVGSSFGAPRSVFLTLSLPLAAEPHHQGE